MTIGRLRRLGEYVQSGQDAGDPAVRTARIRAEMKCLLTTPGLDIPADSLEPYLDYAAAKIASASTAASEGTTAQVRVLPGKNAPGACATPSAPPTSTRARPASPLAAGQSDAYAMLRAQPGRAGAEAALKEAGPIYRSTGPHRIHASDDVRFGLRHGGDDHISRELGEPSPLDQASAHPATGGGAATAVGVLVPGRRSPGVSRPPTHA